MRTADQTVAMMVNWKAGALVELTVAGRVAAMAVMSAALKVVYSVAWLVE